MASRNTKSTPTTTRPVLIPMGPHARKPSMALSRPVTLIGARQNAHLHLVSSTVSKAHALVLNTSQGVYIRDLASRTHLYVNDEPVREAYLQDGDVIRIGSFTFQFAHPTQNEANDADAPPPAAAPQGELHVDSEPIPLPIEERVVLIGRRPNSDIPLVEASVSIAHALVFELDGRRFIRDLGSRTGTWVNGRKIHQEELNPGDQVRIGETTMVYLVRAVQESDEAEDALADMSVPPLALQEPDTGDAPSDSAIAAVAASVEPPSVEAEPPSLEPQPLELDEQPAEEEPAPVERPAAELPLDEAEEEIQDLPPPPHTGEFEPLPLEALDEPLAVDTPSDSAIAAAPTSEPASSESESASLQGPPPQPPSLDLDQPAEEKPPSAEQPAGELPLEEADDEIEALPPAPHTGEFDPLPLEALEEPLAVDQPAEDREQDIDLDLEESTSTPATASQSDTVQSGQDDVLAAVEPDLPEIDLEAPQVQPQDDLAPEPATEDRPAIGQPEAESDAIPLASGDAVEPVEQTTADTTAQSVEPVEQPTPPIELAEPGDREITEPTDQVAAEGKISASEDRPHEPAEHPEDVPLAGTPAVEHVAEMTADSATGEPAAIEPVDQGLSDADLAEPDDRETSQPTAHAETDEDIHAQESQPRDLMDEPGHVPSAGIEAADEPLDLQPAEDEQPAAEIEPSTYEAQPLEFDEQPEAGPVAEVDVAEDSLDLQPPPDKSASEAARPVNAELEAVDDSPQEPVPVPELEDVDFSSLHLELDQNEPTAESADAQMMALDDAAVAGDDDDVPEAEIQQPLLDLAQDEPPQVIDEEVSSQETPLLAPDALDDSIDVRDEHIADKPADHEVSQEVTQESQPASADTAAAITSEADEADQLLQPVQQDELTEAPNEDDAPAPVEEVVAAAEPDEIHELETAVPEAEAATQDDEWTAARDEAKALTDTTFAAAVEQFTGESVGEIVEPQEDQPVEESDAQELAAPAAAAPDLHAPDIAAQEFAVQDLSDHADDELAASAEPAVAGHDMELATKEPVEVDEVLPLDDSPTEPLSMLALDQAEPEELRLEPPAIEQPVEQAISEPPALEMPSVDETTPVPLDLPGEQATVPAHLGEPAEPIAPAAEDQQLQPLGETAEPALREQSPDEPPQPQTSASSPSSWGANQDAFLGGLPLRLDQPQEQPSGFGKVDVDFGAAPPDQAETPAASTEEPPPTEPPPPPPPPAPQRRAAVTPPSPNLPSRRRPLMPPAPVAEPNAFEPAIPPMQDGFSIGAEEFAGLNDGILGDVDVFSQTAPTDIDLSVFADRPPSTEAVGTEQTPDKDDEPSDSSPPEAFGSGPNGEAYNELDAPAHPENATARPINRRRPPRTPVPVPAPPPAARRRRRWRFFSIPVLVFLMFLSLLASATAIFALVPIRYTVQGEVQYTNTDGLTTLEWSNFQDEQRRALHNGDLRNAAINIVLQEHSDLHPGFLTDPEAYYRNDTVEWPRSSRSTLVLRHTGTDESGDQRRIHALMQALYEHNRPLIDRAAESRQRLESLREAITESRKAIQSLDERIRQEEQIAGERSELDERQAYLQARLEQLREELRAASESAAAARVELDANLALVREAEANASADGTQREIAIYGPLNDKIATLEATADRRQQALADVQQRVHELENELKTVSARATQARGAADRLIEFRSDRSVRQQELQQREATLQTEQARVAAAVQQLAPSLEQHVRTERVEDPRPTYAAIAFGAIFAVFAALLLMSTKHGPSPNAGSRPNQRTPHPDEADLQARLSDLGNHDRDRDFQAEDDAGEVPGDSDPSIDPDDRSVPEQEEEPVETARHT